MEPISSVTLQKKYGGMWVALSKDREKVLAAEKKFGELHRHLEKMGVDTTKVIFSKIQKYGVVSVYFEENNQISLPV